MSLIGEIYQTEKTKPIKLKSLTRDLGYVNLIDLENKTVNIGSTYYHTCHVFSRIQETLISCVYNLIRDWIVTHPHCQLHEPKPLQPQLSPQIEYEYDLVGSEYYLYCQDPIPKPLQGAVLSAHITHACDLIESVYDDGLKIIDANLGKLKLKDLEGVDDLVKKVKSTLEKRAFDEGGAYEEGDE